MCIVLVTHLPEESYWNTDFVQHYGGLHTGTLNLPTYLYSLACFISFLLLLDL